MTKGTFGDNLKREREMRGVSLDEISTATRIATRFLVAIENEQWDQLPGGVFNRGFVRAVAHYLGLDEENIVAEYALAVNDRPSVPVWTGTPPPLAPDRRWVAWLVAAVVVVGLIAGVWLGTRRILEWRANRHLKSNIPLSVSSPSLSSIPVSMPETSTTNTPTDISAHGGTDSLAPAASTMSAKPLDTGPTAASASANPVTPSAVSPAPLSADSPMELKIETVKKTKVMVETDTHRAFDGTVRTGDVHTFSAKDRFQISTRDAGALVLQLNGRTLAPIGPLGHAGRLTLSRDALKGSVGGDN